MVVRSGVTCSQGVSIIFAALLLESLQTKAHRDKVTSHGHVSLGHGLLHVEPELLGGSPHSAHGIPAMKLELRGSNSSAVTPEHWKLAGNHTTGILQRSKSLFSKFAKLCSEGPPAFVVAVMQVQPAFRKRAPKSLEDSPMDNSYDGAFFDEDFDVTRLTGMEFANALLCLMFGVFVFNSLADVRGFWRIAHREEKKQDVASTNARSQESAPWSIAMLCGLTAYRFYTGFLTATWLPYLLAMEGQYLWSSNQSTFMGCAKLIYGATILTNPILGLVGDRAVRISHGSGRRLFVRIGVAFAAMGIIVCMVAADMSCYNSFMLGIFLWRIGEAINDVTTEALVPELVSSEQFKLASAVKAALFLFGGLFGYVLLIAAAGFHYSWLYYAYFFGMFITSIPVLVLLNDDSPRAPTSMNPCQDSSFMHQMMEAYLAPSRGEGGFARACLAVFVFSLGTAPMFFLLLIMRDVVGIKDAIQLQEHFSGSSIMFFVSAAIAAVMSGAGPPPRPTDGPSQAPASEELTNSNSNLAEAEGREEPSLVKSILSMVKSVSLFAVMCFILPVVGLFPSMEVRATLFYVIAAIFGYTFGLSFSQFQGITWQLLPPGINLANAMGFNVMSRLLGLGLGNFIAGLILDYFYVDSLSMAVAPDDTLVVQLPMHAEGEYMYIGYVVMCAASGIMTLASAGLVYSIVLTFRADVDMKQKQQAAMIAAAG